MAEYGENAEQRPWTIVSEIVIPETLRGDQCFKNLASAMCSVFSEQNSDVRSLFDWSFNEDGQLVVRQKQDEVGPWNALNPNIGKWIAAFYREQLHLPDTPEFQEFSTEQHIPREMIDEIRKDFAGKEKYLSGIGSVIVPISGRFRRKLLGFLPLPLTDNTKQDALEQRIRESAESRMSSDHNEKENAKIWQWLIDNWQQPHVIQASDNYIKFIKRVSEFFRLRNANRQLTVKERMNAEKFKRAIALWKSGDEEGANKKLEGVSGAS